MKLCFYSLKKTSPRSEACMSVNHHSLPGWKTGKSVKGCSLPELKAGKLVNPRFSSGVKAG